MTDDSCSSVRDGGADVGQQEQPGGEAGALAHRLTHSVSHYQFMFQTLQQLVRMVLYLGCKGQRAVSVLVNKYLIINKGICRPAPVKPCLVITSASLDPEPDQNTAHCEMRGHGFSCNSSEPPEEARKPQLCPAVFTFPSRGGWWLPGNFSMAQSYAACSMRITGCLVAQCAATFW